ncbi:MAG TPA: hydroxymethylbilane synthase [Solirubrobacterales bacterium]|nr:hydroxymethylbilane synthase [Solirubrobacterales bacterium]
MSKPASPRLGTRTSALALAQAEAVAAALGGAEVVPVRTQDAAVGDKSRFVRGVEEELLGGRVDLGVHSAKDLPGELPDGLTLAGVPGREDPTDAFIGAAGSLDEVPEGARIGTSSLRRRSQLLASRPDLQVEGLRGNVDTRLRKLAEGEYEGIVLASAGLARLGRQREISFRFKIEEMTPAPGQGCLALEARADDGDTGAAAGRISDRAALTELTAERVAVRLLEADCDTPVGVCARHEGDELVVRGYAGLPDGSDWVRDRVAGDPTQPGALGEALAERMRAAGAEEILAAVKA